MQIYKMLLSKADISLLYGEYERQSETVRKHIDKHLIEKDRLRSLVGLLLLRQGVLKVYGKGDYTLEYTDNGKPLLDFCNFSISHSRDMVICAISDNNIGADVERLRDIKKREGYAFFSNTEAQFINSQPELSKKRYLQLWTMKEAFVKLNGGKLSDAGKVCFDNFRGESNYKYGKCVFTTSVEDGYLVTICEEKI